MNLFLQGAMVRPAASASPPPTETETLPKDGADTVRKIIHLLPRTEAISTALNVDNFPTEYDAITQNDELWPLYTFILGELHWFNGDRMAAHESYNRLVQWAHSNPGHNSGLAVVALWRDLLIRNEKKQLQKDKEETDEFIRIARRTINTDSANWMFHFFFHTALPKLEEDILRLSAQLAWKVDVPKSKKRAASLLLDYLLMASKSELDPTEKRIRG
jgi:hypothetical protein